MAGRKATPQDGELILKLYELRREPVMRQARVDIGKFTPRSWDDVAAVLKPEHPFNVAYRMTSTYWEMAAGLAKHGALAVELFGENCGEGVILYARMEPFIGRLRKEYSPFAFRNMEWVVKKASWAKQRLEIQRKKLAAVRT